MHKIYYWKHYLNIMKKREKTRHEIIETAQKLFSERGRKNVTMGDIAEACNKSRRTIYNYFINTDFLYFAIIEDELELMLSELTTIANSALPADKKLENFILMHFRCIRKATERNASVRTSFYKNYEEIERARRPIDFKEIRIIKQILTEGSMNGIFDIHDTQWFAMLILYAIKGIELPYLNHNIGTHLSENFSSIMLRIFNGILRRRI